MTQRPPLLDGVRVIESSILGPGLVSTFLSDLGADVIKVEPPTGDYIRQMTWPIVDGTSLLHLHTHRGKRSVTLDLKTPEGVVIYKRLVAEADVVVEAMRPGSLDRLGLGYDVLVEANPRIVFCTISGYGSSGPYKDMPSHGIAYDTWAGIIQPVVDDDDFCHIPPDMPNIGINAGPMLGAVAILAGVISSRSIGRGCEIELAQSDAAAYMDWYRIESERAYERPDSEVTGNASDDYERRPAGLAGMWDGVRYQIYAATDGHVLLMASERTFWQSFCEGVGRPDIFNRWPGSKYADHARGNRELQAELREIFLSRSRSDWIAFSIEHDTPIAPVNSPATVGDDPQFAHRLPFLAIGQVGTEQLPLPVRVSGSLPSPPTMAPTVGQHTDEVLADLLGISDDELAVLRASGTFG